MVVRKLLSYFEQYPNQIQTNKYILFSFLENADTNVSHNPEKLAGNARKELQERVKMIWRLLVNILECCNIYLSGVPSYSAMVYNFILLMIYNPKKGLTWILARDILTGDNANENYCTMQCEMRDECEYTTSLNIW